MAASHSFSRLRPFIGPAYLRRSTASGCLRVRPAVLPISSTPIPIVHATATRWQSGQPPQPPAAGGASDYQLGPSNDVQPQPSTQHFGQENGDQDERDARRGARSKGGPSKDGAGGGSGSSGAHSEYTGTAWKMFESAATTAASLSVLGIAGYGYHKYYKRLVQKKIDNAFNEGDPALKLASASQHKPDEPWIEREQEDLIHRIIQGEEHGHYYLLIGEKGTGKTSMLLNAMSKNKKGESCSMMEAHADPEIFRLRLGKALDFEFHEDYIGSLFSIRGPRETTALLDIERAFNKLEKVALERRQRTGKPLVMIINGMHMIHDDEIGKDLLELLQQRAEGWAAAGLVTIIFNSDDYWVYERMKQYGSRMELISVRDLPKEQAISALKLLRSKTSYACPEDAGLFEEVYNRVGGRLAFLSKVAKSQDMLGKCVDIYEHERTWFLNKCWILGKGMDDDVMDQQKLASSAMVLVKYLVDTENGEKNDPKTGHILPEVALHKAREVMTRADFIQQFDHDNVFTIDSKAKVRADSVPMMQVFRDIVKEDVDGKSFAQFLDETLERIGDIESLGRTRELTFKDLWNGGKYKMEIKDSKGRTEKTVVLDVARGHKGIHGDEGDEADGEKDD